MPLLPASTSLPLLLLLLHLLYRAAEAVRLNVRTAVGPIGTVEVQTFEELDTLLPKFLLEKGIPEDEVVDYHESLRSSVIQDRVFPAAMVPLICKGQDALVEIYADERPDEVAVHAARQCSLPHRDMFNLFIHLVNGLRRARVIDLLGPEDLAAKYGPPPLPQTQGLGLPPGTRPFSGLRIFIPQEHQYFDYNILALIAALEERSLRTGRAIPFEVTGRLPLEGEEAASVGRPLLYLLFTTHEPRLPLPQYYLSYNLEQVCAGPETLRGYWDFVKLQGAIEVWDYSPLNIQCLKDKGGFARRGVRHVPMGYSTAFEARLDPLRLRSVDVIFLGNLNPRREAILGPTFRALEAEGYTVKTCANSCWGNERYDARIGVNIQFNAEGTVLEMHRILPWVTNHVWVVTTPGNDTWLADEYGDIVDVAAAEELPQAVLRVARMGREFFLEGVRARYAALVAAHAAHGYLETSGAFGVLEELVG